MSNLKRCPFCGGVIKMSEYNDYCEDCAIYGDHYFMNEDGEYECRCPQCAFDPYADEEDD